MKSLRDAGATKSDLRLGCYAMSCERGGDFAGGAGDGEAREVVERQNARARQLRQARDAREKWQQRDVTERDAVACFGQSFEVE